MRPRPNGCCSSQYVNGTNLTNSTPRHFTFPLYNEIVQRHGEVFGDRDKRIFRGSVNASNLVWKAKAPSSRGGSLAPHPIGGWFCATLNAYRAGRERGGWAMYLQTDSRVPVATRYRYIVDEGGALAGSVYSMIPLHLTKCYNDLVHARPECVAALPREYDNCTDAFNSTPAALHPPRPPML